MNIGLYIFRRIRYKVFLPLWQKAGIGMKLAQWRDKNPNICWADICVDLGMGHKLFRRYNESGPCGTRLSAPSDFEQESKSELCYCGKMATDVSKDLNTPTETTPFLERN